MATTAPPKDAGVFNLPNQLTFLRLGLSVVLFVLISSGSWMACVLVFAVAAFTDWLDGYLARKQGLTSALGRNLDPLVDKVLICGAYIFLLPVAGAGLVPWMTTLVVARELIITSLRGFMESRGASFGADWLGKIKMVLQCAALLAIFIDLEAAACCPAQSAWLGPVRSACIYGMLVSTALSGLQYLWRAALALRNDPAV